MHFFRLTHAFLGKKHGKGDQGSGGSNSPWSEFWSEYFIGMGVVPAPSSSVREPSGDSRESGDPRESANQFARIGPSKPQKFSKIETSSPEVLSLVGDPLPRPKQDTFLE